jgi:Tfp pilus assembly protein PilF
MAFLTTPPSRLRTLLLFFLAFALPPVAQGKDSWVEVHSPNFTVISNSGDKEARKVADQFEQFREVLHNTFPKLRLDLGKPLIIFAVKDENSLKLLLPSFWQVKGHAHPAGIYVPGEERHFVAVRTNLEGDNPYEVVYHEYTHAIMNLNFRGLPIWLGEGLAEFYGNTAIHDKDVEVGKPSRYHLQALQQNRLIPIEMLLTADAHSPYYNEENRVSLFYAESWAIVHYLMMDPEARKRQLLTNFLNAWNESGDQVQAAQQTFGDLKKFAQAMEAYARQPAFYIARVSTSIHGDPKSYSSRELPPAELDADRAIFYIHTHRPNEAQASIDEALKKDPNLPLAYEARGLQAYSRPDFPAAEADFLRAIELNSTSYFVYYFDGEARLRRGMPSPDDRVKIIALLEKAVAMNPQFAPAYAALASVYSMQPDTQQKAFEMGRKSVTLEPGNLSYAINFGYVLLNAGQTADAKVLIARIREVVKTPEDQAGLEALESAAASREDYDKRVAEHTRLASQPPDNAGAANSNTSTTSTTTVVVTSAPPPPNARPSSKHANETEYAAEGIIASADCSEDTSGKVTLTVNRAGIRFIYPSLKALNIVSTVKEDARTAPACSAWKGRRARLYFYQTKDKPYAGEVDTIQFF